MHKFPIILYRGNYDGEEYLVGKTAFTNRNYLSVGRVMNYQKTLEITSYHEPSDDPLNLNGHRAKDFCEKFTEEQRKRMLEVGNLKADLAKIEEEIQIKKKLIRELSQATL